MRRIIVKEGPLVFLRNVLAMEIIASLFFFGLSFLGNYEMLLKGFGLTNYIRFDLLEIILFSIFQMVYISALFLNWYFSHYEILEKEIIKKSGLLFRHRKSVSLSDVRKGEISKEIEKMVVKTIVGFLNANGGTLIIGVSDSGQIVGLENDYKTLPKKNKDGFENHLSMLVKTMVGLPFTKYVHVSFETIENKEICLVTVRESHKPAYLTNGDKKEDFYVRVGNSTQPFSMSEMTEYIKTHWS